MSLIKVDIDNKIKGTWLKTKSTNRLKKILFKLRKQYNILQKVSETLRGHNIIVPEDVLDKIQKYIYISAQLNNIICRREI
jgi:hypothetical protein